MHINANKSCLSCNEMAYKNTSTSQLIFAATSLWTCHVIYNTHMHVFPLQITISTRCILTWWSLYIIITLWNTSPLLLANYVTFQHNSFWRMLKTVNGKNDTWEYIRSQSNTIDGMYTFKGALNMMMFCLHLHAMCINCVFYFAAMTVNE